MNEECVHSWGNKEGNVMRVRAPWFTREGGNRWYCGVREWRAMNARQEHWLGLACVAAEEMSCGITIP